MRKVKSPTLFLILALALPAHAQETICKGFSDAEIERRLDELTTLVTCSMEVSLGNCQLQAGIGATGAAVLGSSAVAAMLKNRPEVCGIQGTSAANKIWNGIFPEAYAVQPCYKPFQRGTTATGQARLPTERVSRGMVTQSADMYFKALKADAQAGMDTSDDYLKKEYTNAKVNLDIDRVGATVTTAMRNEDVAAAIRKDANTYKIFQEFSQNYGTWDEETFFKKQKELEEAVKKISQTSPKAHAAYEATRQQMNERAKPVKRVITLAEAESRAPQKGQYLSKVESNWTPADEDNFKRTRAFMQHAKARAGLAQYQSHYDEVLGKLKTQPVGAGNSQLQIIENARVHTMTNGQNPKANLTALRMHLNSNYAIHTGKAVGGGGGRWQAFMASKGALGVGARGGLALGKQLFAISPIGFGLEAMAHTSSMGCESSPFEQLDEKCTLIPELTGPFVNFLTMDPEYRLAILKKDPNMCSVLSQTYDNVAGTWDLKCQSGGMMMVNKKFPQRAVKLEQDSEGGPLSVKMLFEDKNPRSNFEMKFDRNGEPTEASLDQWKSHATRARTRDFDPKNNKNRQWEGPDFIHQKFDATGASANTFRSEFSDEMAEYKTRLAQISTAQICCQSRESAQKEPGCSAFSDIQYKSGSGPTTRRTAPSAGKSQ